jgi:hypothetical protein
VRPARKVENLTAICEPIVWKMWEPRHLTACYRDKFTFYQELLKSCSRILKYTHQLYNKLLFNDLIRGDGQFMRSIHIAPNFNCRYCRT